MSPWVGMSMDRKAKAREFHRAEGYRAGLLRAAEIARRFPLPGAATIESAAAANLARKIADAIEREANNAGAGQAGWADKIATCPIPVSTPAPADSDDPFHLRDPLKPICHQSVAMKRYNAGAGATRREGYMAGRDAITGAAGNG